MTRIAIEEKYAQPEVVSCWQNLSQDGLQKCESEMIARYLPPEGHLLDLGCGTGRALLALGQAGYTVTGIDLSLPMLQAGRTLSGEARFAGANLLALPFADQSFKAVLMFFGALQHISGRDNRRLAMAEMARVTQSQGRLILGLDNLAPALTCYLYWLKEKLIPSAQTGLVRKTSTTADATLWSRETRRVNPLVWHIRGLARTLRWRTWAGLVDLTRPFFGAEPGDTQVAQFSLHTTPGKIYYHVYRDGELMQDAARTGWQLLGHYSGTELNEACLYPASIRGLDKQQLFAFQKM